MRSNVYQVRKYVLAARVRALARPALFTISRRVENSLSGKRTGAHATRARTRVNRFYPLSLVRRDRFHQSRAVTREANCRHRADKNATVVGRIFIIRALARAFPPIKSDLEESESETTRERLATNDKKILFFLCVIARDFVDRDESKR